MRSDEMVHDQKDVTAGIVKNQDLIIDDRDYHYDPSKPKLGLTDREYEGFLRIREAMKERK